MRYGLAAPHRRPLEYADHLVPLNNVPRRLAPVALVVAVDLTSGRTLATSALMRFICAVSSGAKSTPSKTIRARPCSSFRVADVLAFSNINRRSAASPLNSAYLVLLVIVRSRTFTCSPLKQMDRVQPFATTSKLASRC